MLSITFFTIHYLAYFPTIPARRYFCFMNWLWVALGGAIGSCARFALSLAWPFDGKGFPLATLSVNLFGCLLIGILVPLLPQGWPRLLLISGVLGGFTTYSGFGLETQMLLQEGRNGAALGYLVITLLGGIICTAAGWKAAQFMNLSAS